MPYNIFTQQGLFQHNHDAYRSGSTTPDGVIVPGGVATPSQQTVQGAATQPAVNAGAGVPGMEVAKRIVQQYQSQQPRGGQGTDFVMPTPQSSWHGKDATAPDGGFFSWSGRTFTTPEQEQQYRKQSRARMGIMAVADALRHLGNIYHTTKYAPSQQFNKPVEQEYAMYRAQKAERDKDNYAIQQQQLAQAKWEADQAYKQATLGWRAKDYAIKERAADRADAKAKQDQSNWEKTFEANQGWRDYQKERQTKMDDHRIKVDNERLAQGQQGLAIRWANFQETQAQHAWTRQNGGANGSGKQKVFFTGTHGSVSRNQGMTLDESVNMVNNLHKKGWVTDKKYNEFMSAIQGGNEAGMYSILYGGAGAGGKGATGGIIEGVLTYHKDGAKWLADNYNFNITGPGTGTPVYVKKVIPPKKSSAPAQKAATTQKAAAQGTTTVKASGRTQSAAQKAAGGQKATQRGGSTVSKKGSVPTKKADEKKKKGDYSGFSIHNK